MFGWLKLLFGYLFYLICSSFKMLTAHLLNRFIKSKGDKCHASSSRKSSKRIGMRHLHGSAKERHSSFLLFGTSPDLSGMLQTEITGMSSLQARLQESLSIEESFG